jgi:hypothetical protein
MADIMVICWYSYVLFNACTYLLDRIIESEIVVRRGRSATRTIDMMVPGQTTFVDGLGDGIIDYWLDSTAFRAHYSYSSPLQIETGDFTCQVSHFAADCIVQYVGTRSEAIETPQVRLRCLFIRVARKMTAENTPPVHT